MKGFELNFSPFDLKFQHFEGFIRLDNFNILSFQLIIVANQQCMSFIEVIVIFLVFAIE